MGKMQTTHSCTVRFGDVPNSILRVGVFQSFGIKMCLNRDHSSTNSHKTCSSRIISPIIPLTLHGQAEN